MLTTCHVLCDKLSVESRISSRQTVCVTTEEKFLKKFGKRLATVRKQKGVTQEKLAEMVDVHRTYIGFIEAGKRNPSIGNIHKIAKALKVDIKELF